MPTRLGFVWHLLFGVVVCVGFIGCGSATKTAERSSTATENSEKPDAASEKLPPTETVDAEGDDEDESPSTEIGDDVEPFEVPPLDELIKNNQWVDQPVVDTMDLMREEQAKRGPPKMTVKEALAIRNNSDEENADIIDTLGRLAPEDGSGVDYEATFLRRVNTDLKTTNPVLMSTQTDQYVTNLMGISPIAFDWRFKVYGDKDVIVSWQTSEDRMVDKMELRKDLTWSDGKPVTAHDFVFGFQVIMTKSVIAPAVRQSASKIRWVEAYDDHTLVFFHKDPLATHKANLELSPLPKHIYKDTVIDDPTFAESKRHNELEDHPVVAGKYILTKRERGQEFVLKRREEYFMYNGKQVRSKPYFKEMRFKVISDPNTAFLALKTGEVDEIVITSEQWVTKADDDSFNKKATRVTAVQWTSAIFCWNLSKPYFEDKRVRKAMAYAVDYEEMLNTIMYKLNKPNRGTYHPTSWMHPKDSPSPYTFDLDKAEDLLDEAGWDDSDGDGVRDRMVNGKLIPFRFTLLVPQSPSSIKIGTLFKEGLDQIGIECIVKSTEFTVMAQLNRDHEYDASLFAWGTGAEPDSTSNLFVTDAGRNYGEYSNPKVDDLFEAARKEFDPEKRAELYGKIHTQLWEDQPYCWLCYRNAFYGFSKELRGYNFSPRGPYSPGPGIDSIYKAK